MTSQDGKMIRRRGRTDNDQPREGGFLHPHAYLWTIDKFFDGLAPERINKMFWKATKAWGHYCTSHGCRQGITSNYLAIGKDKMGNLVLKPWE